jgi:hypothetical protein
MKLRPADPKFKLTREELSHFCAYLDKAKLQAFTGVNNFMRHARDREELYQFALSTLTEKAFLKLMANAYKPMNTKLSVAINFSEQKVLFDVVFKRVEANNPFLYAIIQDISQQLKPLLNAAPYTN